ncbi:hypothetical protein BDR04DRAFT_1094834 [Suillus decipiens]|nr:hypothetical protein BDR04DRAFT_1094834 [Suillus decipiens]
MYGNHYHQKSISASTFMLELCKIINLMFQHSIQSINQHSFHGVLFMFQQGKCSMMNRASSSLPV